MHPFHGRFFFFAMCFWIFSAASLFAAYPEKPIRIVLPYVAGGSGDLILRTIQPGLEKRLGQVLVVDYRTGAAGNIGAQEVVRAAPDGYTLLFGPTNNFVINQFLYGSLGFDPLQALAPVTIVADTPYLVITNDFVPSKRFAEFAIFARANPGKLNYGSPGSATVPHLSGFMLSEAIGARMVHIPYRGSQPGVQALLANDVQMLIHSYGAIAGYIASGRLHALAVGAPERLKLLPGVPTTAEAGIPQGVILGNWWAIAAPRATDPAIVTRLAQEIRAVFVDAELQKKYFEQGWMTGGSPPAEVAERMRLEATAWKRIVERSDAKVDN